MSIRAWALEVTVRGDPTVLAEYVRGQDADDPDRLQVIDAEGMDPLDDVGYTPDGLVVPLSSPKVDELVANRLLHVRNLETGEIITSCVMGAPSDKIRPLGVGQVRTVPLYSLPQVLNDSVVVPPGGWNVLPRGDDRHYDWSDPTFMAAGGSIPIEVGTVAEVNAIPYPVIPYFSSAAKPAETLVITYSGGTDLTIDAPAGTIYSREDVAIPAGFYKFRGVGDNWIDTLRVQGTEILGFQFGFIDGWESQTFEWSGGDPEVISGKMAIACAWSNQPEDGRGPITLTLELINATTGDVVWSTSEEFKGAEFPDHAPAGTDGAIARVNLAQSQGIMGALVDVIPTFDGTVDSNGVNWEEVEGLQDVSTKSRTKLGAFHLHERSKFVESRLRFVDSGGDAGKIAWDYYLLGGRGEIKVGVAIEVDVDIRTMSIDRDGPSATSLAYATKDRFILRVDDPPLGQPVVVGVADYEAAGTLDEASRVARADLEDFNHIREKLAIEHATWAGDYWTADTIPAVATDGDGGVDGLRVQNMHWWKSKNGDLDAEPEFGELFVPVMARSANAQARLAPRGLAGRSRRATRG